MKHRIMIRSLPEAMAVVKEMNVSSQDDTQASEAKGSNIF